MAFSQDLRLTALRLMSEGKKTRKEVALLLDVHEKTLTRWKQRAAEDRLATEYPKERGGYKIKEEDLRQRVASRPDAFLHEHAKDFDVSAYAIGRALKRMGISRKKFTPCYKERCEQKRQEFHDLLFSILGRELIYLDECGIGGLLRRLFGYTEVGTRYEAFISGKRSKKTNVIGAWSDEKKLFAAQTYDVNINGEVFKQWVEDHLLEHLGPNSAVILDNASFHKGEEIREMIEKKGAKLIFLPPYSPDLNCIEHIWANLKDAIRKNAHLFADKAENIQAQIKALGTF
jgi:transposase